MQRRRLVLKTGMMEDLLDITRNLEQAKSDKAQYDSDRVISFHHTGQRIVFMQLYEDFEVLQRFSGKVGEIFDQPFYEDIDAFVETIRYISISNYTTKNRIGSTKEKMVYTDYGTQQEFKMPKTEVSLTDLCSGSSFYAKQMKQELDNWKELNHVGNMDL
jgi:hypothetical protein